ncbi:hypothetical protein BHM03_00038331 [Ensete ventricosum]|nr:hypothetical protein BHM03_00038331 [Ensete ventricosum]
MALTFTSASPQDSTIAKVNLGGLHMHLPASNLAVHSLTPQFLFPQYVRCDVGGRGMASLRCTFGLSGKDQSSFHIATLFSTGIESKTGGAFASFSHTQSFTTRSLIPHHFLVELKEAVVQPRRATAVTL